MPNVTLHPLHVVPDDQLAFAVVMTRHLGRWLFVRHKERSTWEIPGGHRESGEAIEKTAQRELYEETGVMASTLMPVYAYEVSGEGRRSCGMLYWAEAASIAGLPESEIAEVQYFDRLPESLTYPEIQPVLYRAAAEYAASYEYTMGEMY